MNTIAPLFLSHGSPMTALEPREAGAFFQQLGATLPALPGGKPKAMLIASAHSLTREPVLLAAPRHEAVYDFGGFDPKLYTLRYDVPGAPELARRVEALIKGSGLPVHRVDEGGLDHGIWTPLRWAFPDADIPVLPLAWPPHWRPSQLFALGQALAPLADDGVLIIGSGSITHNLRRVFAGGGLHPPERPETPESAAFRTWFADRAAAADWTTLLDYRAQAPHAALMHPTDEHLLPWYVAAGAGGAHPAARIHDSIVFGELGMDAYAFGPGAAALRAALRAESPQPVRA